MVCGKALILINKLLHSGPG